MAEFFRFGIKTKDGRRSSTWGLASSEGGAVHVYRNSPTDALTATLEPDGICRLSARAHFPDAPDTAGEIRWSGTKGPLPTTLLLYQLVFPIAELRHFKEDTPTEAAWIRPRGSGDAIEVLFCVVEAATSEPRFPGMAVLLTQHMTAGRTLYVIYRNTPVLPEKLAAVADWKRHLVQLPGADAGPTTRPAVIFVNPAGLRSVVEIAGDLPDNAECELQTQATAVGAAHPDPENAPHINGVAETAGAEDELSIEGFGIHLTKEVGTTEDLLYFARIIPDGREGRIVYARTLQRGEPDPGATVTIRPRTGETLEFREGGLFVSIAEVDDLLLKTTPSGQITNTLWTWFRIAATGTTEQHNYILAAGRRLDSAKILHTNILQLLDQVGAQDLRPLRRRHAAYEAIATAEIFIVALNRALQMIVALKKYFGVTASIPVEITSAVEAIYHIRNAYEHIEDRAFGKVKRKPDADALSVFDYTRFITSGVVSYAGHQLDVRAQTIAIFVAAREYLLTVTAELCGPMRINTAAIAFFEAPKEQQNRT